MAQVTPTGGIRLFRVFGITVFLHWSWFILAMWDLRDRGIDNLPIGWRIAEYLSLFGIVLLHEFGHSLACRSVGGEADRIVLWPLGGAAYVSPPMRPAPFLWSIVAGPLVNVVLAPLFYVGMMLQLGSVESHQLAVHLFVINLVLLVFNILPIYPLDGGKILWCLLWFLLGQGRSLLVASVIGIIGSIGLVALAFSMGNNWLILIAVYGAFQCYNGFQQSRFLRRIETAPRHTHAHCPRCNVSPPAGTHWTCGCGQRFDPFVTGFVCPGCGRGIGRVPCINCRGIIPSHAWFAPAGAFPVRDAAPLAVIPLESDSPSPPPVASLPAAPTTEPIAPGNHGN